MQGARFVLPDVSTHAKVEVRHVAQRSEAAIANKTQSPITEIVGSLRQVGRQQWLEEANPVKRHEAKRHADMFVILGSRKAASTVGDTAEDTKQRELVGC